MDLGIQVDELSRKKASWKLRTINGLLSNSWKLFTSLVLPEGVENISFPDRSNKRATVTRRCRDSPGPMLRRARRAKRSFRAMLAAECSKTGAAVPYSQFSDNPFFISSLKCSWILISLSAVEWICTACMAARRRARIHGHKGHANPEDLGWPRPTWKGSRDFFITNQPEPGRSTCLFFSLKI